MSRPRKPTEALLLSGAFDKNPARAIARQNEPASTCELGNAPSYLTSDEKKVWRETRRSAPWITAADQFALEAVCRLVARMRTGDMKAADYGVLRSLLSSLGLTPGDRSKVAIKPEKKPAKDDNEFAISRPRDFVRAGGFERRDFGLQAGQASVPKISRLPN